MSACLIDELINLARGFRSSSYQSQEVICDLWYWLHWWYFFFLRFFWDESDWWRTWYQMRHHWLHSGDKSVAKISMQSNTIVFEFGCNIIGSCKIHSGSAALPIAGTFSFSCKMNIYGVEKEGVRWCHRRCELRMELDMLILLEGLKMVIVRGYWEHWVNQTKQNHSIFNKMQYNTIQANTKQIQSKYKANTKQIQSKYKANTKQT